MWKMHYGKNQQTHIVMKRLLAIVPLFVLGLIPFGSQALSDHTPHASKGGSVYACYGEKAYAYHRNRNCSGLNRCSGTIKAISVSKAKSEGRSACRKCY